MLTIKIKGLGEEENRQLEEEKKQEKEAFKSKTEKQRGALNYLQTLAESLGGISPFSAPWCQSLYNPSPDRWF